MFTGLSAFPLTPVNELSIDEASFIGLIERLVEANVNSITVLGSTGCYPYLSGKERLLTAKNAIDTAVNIPVVVGISALRTKDVLALAYDAQKAGAKGLLLSPMSYQKLTDDEVFSHFETVSRNISLPLCVYENPTTTNFVFSDELYVRITELKNIASIKIPPLPNDNKQAVARVNNLRLQIPAHVTIGISGDYSGALGMNAGCDVWYSALGGLLPNPILEIINASKNGQFEEANQISAKLEPIWKLFRQYGSLRVIATIAELMGLVKTPCLPMPLKSLINEDRNLIQRIVEKQNFIIIG